VAEELVERGDAGLVQGCAVGESDGANVTRYAGEAACPQVWVRRQRRRAQGEIAAVEDGVADQGGAARLVVEGDVARTVAAWAEKDTVYSLYTESFFFALRWYTIME
jgi:hypothetical protein